MSKGELGTQPPGFQIQASMVGPMTICVVKCSSLLSLIIFPQDVHKSSLTKSNWSVTT